MQSKTSHWWLWAFLGGAVAVGWYVIGSSPSNAPAKATQSASGDIEIPAGTVQTYDQNYNAGEKLGAQDGKLDGCAHAEYMTRGYNRVKQQSASSAPVRDGF